jgi:sortase A
MVAATLILAFAINIVLLSQVQHLVSQQKLHDSFRAELSAGTAPVSEGDFNNVLLADGAPVAVLDIPTIGVHEVIVEGTNPSTLMSGPGHRRDTVLPGQVGTSVILGRAAAYGGPFSRLQQLAPGDRFSVTTGQGVQSFAVIGLRYAGDPTLPAPSATQSRITLETGRGAPFMPTGVAYVDAELTSAPQNAGLRQTTAATLDPRDVALATDTSTVWALVFAIQFLIAVEIGAVWAYRRIGAQKTWVVFAPATLLAVLLVGTQLAVLLPNVL